MKGIQNYTRLMSDRVRVERFRDAISAAVRPGDVVIDIGSGTGILALYAIRAGAARCYAVEREPEIAPVARRFLEANGVADKVPYLTGLADAVALPEPADLVMAELLGHIGVDEHIHEILGPVCRRALKPGGRVLPRHLTTFLVPVQVEQSGGEPWINDFTDPDFTLVPELLPFPNPPMTVVGLPPSPLGPPAIIERFAVADPDHTRSGAAELELAIDRQGRFDGVMAGFDAELTPGIGLANFPPYLGTSWINWHRGLAEPRQVAGGERFPVRVSNMHAFHPWDWELEGAALAFADGPMR